MIVFLPDYQPYSYMTVREAVHNLAVRNNLWFSERDPKSFGPCSNIVQSVCDWTTLVIAEAATLKLNHVTTSYLKYIFPKAKLVVLSTDAIYYRHYKNDFEFATPKDCDLVLDCMSDTVQWFNDHGVRSDIWWWTISDMYFNMFMERYRSWTRLWNFKHLAGLFKETPYRTLLCEHLKSCGFTVLKTSSFDPDQLWALYSSTNFTLGTTSPSWTGCRTMKGFRDWIGPACGSLLVYDDHPDISKWPVPTYQFEDPYTLTNLLDSLKDPVVYGKVLWEQQEWLRENTIEKQLGRLLVKHNIL